MADLLLWLYLANSILLIIHEIDSAFWKEWELFKLPGKIEVFLLLHFPLLLVILWGLILVSRHSWWGFVSSLILSVGGLFAFGIHFYFLGKGRPEFNTAMSKSLLIAILGVSLIQLAVTFYGIGQ